MALQPQSEQEEQQQFNGRDEGGVKAPRLPRWTRQEILVLIQGKRVAENRVRRGRSAALAYGGVGSAPAVEPKWATVSSYCKRHGVNRGPVQCRKRWSNLAGDFKKIKEWESQIKDESESFWVMRNDVRRERKLPGFFDKEVYDILDGAAPQPQPLSLSLSGQEANKDTQDANQVKEDTEDTEEEEAVFDSGRSAAAEDGLFSDLEHSVSVHVQDEMGKESHTHKHTHTPDKEAPSSPAVAAAAAAIPSPTPISEKQYEPFTGTADGTEAVASEKQPAVNPEVGSTSREGRKRRRFLSDGGDTAEVEAGDQGASLALQNQLVDVLERNGRILCAQLEAQNINLKLDREERKDHASGLVAVLNKLADALGKIADKL